MTDRDHDVIIVGSGPAGVSTWLHLHRYDPALAARTLVLEKAQHPRPKLCGGGVMRAADTVLAQLRAPIDVPSVPIHNVEFRYRGRHFYRRQKDYFRIVRRHQFDAALVDVARRRGMTLHQQEAFQDFTRLDDGVQVETVRGMYRTRALVAADGANSVVRSRLNTKGKPRTSRLIEILTPVDPATAPEFVNNTAVFDYDGVDQGLQGYIWDFPCWENGSAAMNRGIYDGRFFPRRRRADLKSLFHAGLQARNAFDPDQHWQGHPERWFDPRATIAQPGVLLVGDAAGIDPFVGEGISFALMYGDVAAAELVAAFQTDDFGFDRYRDHVVAHPLGQSLRLRRLLAALAYPGWPSFVLSLFVRIMGRVWP